MQENNTEKELINETNKWLEKALEKRKVVSGRKGFLENIDAYLKDAGHFLKEKDFVMAFESVVWAWAWIEIGLQEKILEEKE
ncbi:DUF357 domain-containing protein [archaeon]|nr:DUF357 domain-containing protein [archaeon]